MRSVARFLMSVVAWCFVYIAGRLVLDALFGNRPADFYQSLAVMLPTIFAVEISRWIDQP